MEDFKERLVSLFRQGLIWAWPNIRIEAEHVTGYVPRGFEHPSESAKKWASGEYEMIDPSMEYVAVKIYFPEEYKVSHPNWIGLGFAGPIPCGCAHILRAIGLGSMLADSSFLPKEGYIMYYTNINRNVYDRIPSPLHQQLPIEVTATSNVTSKAIVEE